MSRLLILFAALFVPMVGFAEPATIKELLAQESKWAVSFSKEPAAPGRPPAPALESARVFLARIAGGRADGERKFAAKIAKANWSAIDSRVLGPAGDIDAATAKALRSVLERIAAAPSASPRDQAELKRLLESAR